MFELSNPIFFPFYFDTSAKQKQKTADGIAYVWPVHWFYITL